MKLGMLSAAVVVAVAGYAGVDSASAGTVTQVSSSQFASGGQTFGFARGRWNTGVPGNNGGSFDLVVSGNNSTTGAPNATFAGSTGANVFVGTFTLSFVASSKQLTFSMTNTSPSETQTRTVVAGLSTNVFNTFQFSGNTSSSGGTIAATNMQFTSGHTGTIPNLNSSNSFDNFYLFSAANLAGTDFTLTGDLSLSRGTNGAVERPSFTISLEQKTLLVPLPPAAWAGLGSLACVAGFGVIRRRRMAAN